MKLKVGLINIEPKVVNTALMQIAAAHRDTGDTVEWAMPLEYDRYDRLYCSSIFSFTDKSQIPDRTVCGGTGFDVGSKLPKWIERAGYDYRIYPECDYSIVWFSRGCVRNCGFCIVREKEGMVRPADQKNLNPAGEYVIVQDNNFFASPKWAAAIRCLNIWGLPVDFQGVDVRLMTAHHFEALATVKLVKDQAIKIAWDGPKSDIIPSLRKMLKFIPANKIMCYVLIGYDSTLKQDLRRIRTLWGCYRVRPYVMSYNERSPYQKSFERWVNGHFYKTTGWADYKYRKEFDPAIDRVA